MYFFSILDMNDNKNFRRSSKSSYDKKKETDEDDREDEELDWSHTVCFFTFCCLFGSLIKAKPSLNL